MKLPSLVWDKVVAGGRAAWNVTSSASGLVKSKRAMVAAATLGVGTLTSSAGYFIWQGRAGNPAVEVASGDSTENPLGPDASGPPAIQPIHDADGAGDAGPGLAVDESGGSFGSSQNSPLRPPPASAFRNGGFQGAGRSVGDDVGDDSSRFADPGLGNPATEEPEAVPDGQSMVADETENGGQSPANVAGEDSRLADESVPGEMNGRPRILAVGDGPIRQAGADDAAAANSDAMNQDAQGGSEPNVAVPMDPVAGAEGDPANSSNEPAPSNALQPVPNLSEGAEPAPPPPPPDRIVIPADPPATLRPNTVGGSSTSGFGAPVSGTNRAAPPNSRFGGTPSLAPVPSAAAGSAFGAAAAGTVGDTAGTLGDVAAGALAGAGVAGIGAALADDGPTISRPTPGPKELEGVQTPSLTLEKFAPEEIQVGKPAVFQIKVRNVGRVAAHGVVISDHVPVGTKLLDADPEFARGADGVIRWQLGTLAPSQEVMLAMKLLPEQEGEIGSVAQVSFQSQASVRTVCTRPQITLQHQTQQKALIGDDVVLAITIANNGTGAATGLVIEEAVPQGLAHPVDKELEYLVGTLKPGESRRLELTLKAAQAGIVENILVARSDETVVAEDRLRLEVVAPQLKVGLTGPKVRYLDRQAIYSVSVANPGTASGKNVELAAYLPRGLKFIAAENQGQYDTKLHAVFWGLADLPVGATGAAQLTVLPIEPGQQAIKVTGQGDLGIQDELQQTVVVETLSELQFSVADVADPIEVGSDTTYDVRVTNRGTRAATNVQLVIEFPAELQPLGGEGPSRVTARGQQIVVEPLSRLAQDTEARYKIQARGLRAGDPRIRVQLFSAESPTPVSKEESTRVYADE